MSRYKKGRPIYLSPGFTEEDWKAAFEGGEDWKKAIEIVEDRIKGRWLDAIDLLLDQPHFGFAILTLDCVVLESLWGFMKGKPTPTCRDGSEKVYRFMLTSEFIRFTEAEADSFRLQIRNGIMHDAETRQHWIIGRTVPRKAIIEKNKGGYKINRTRFHQALKETFDNWIARLHDGEAVALENMRERMDQIIAKHHGR